MTQPGAALRDLVRDVPDHLSVDPRAAWAAGSRRRRRRRGALAVVTLAVVATLGALVGVLPATLSPPAPAGTSVGVSAHPVRIGHSWWVRPLPARPGPVAGLIEHGGSGWYAVSATGHLWELPDSEGGDVLPTLSPDGTRVGFLHAGGTYEIHDLVTGARTRFTNVGDGSFDGSTARYDGDHAYWVSSQQPGFWSPDGTAVLLSGGHTARTSSERLLLGVDGSVRTPRSLYDERRSAFPIGWTPDGSIGWLQADEAQDGSARNLTYVTTTIQARVLSRHPLADTGHSTQLSQWSGRLSPDGRQLAVTQDRGLGGSVVVTYATASGRHTGTAVRLAASDTSCPTVWYDGRPVVPDDSGHPDEGSGASTLLSAAGGPVMIADARLETGCSVWAQAALDGPGASGPVGHLLGMRTATWTWWWQEALVGLAVVAALVVATTRWRRRRSGGPWVDR